MRKKLLELKQRLENIEDDEGGQFAILTFSIGYKDAHFKDTEGVKLEFQLGVNEDVKNFKTRVIAKAHEFYSNLIIFSVLEARRQSDEDR